MYLRFNLKPRKVNLLNCTLGDLMDEESVLDFLTSLEAMDLPDRIEEVNQKILGKIIEDTDYVAVLFCKYCGDTAPSVFFFIDFINYCDKFFQNHLQLTSRQKPTVKSIMCT